MSGLCGRFGFGLRFIFLGLGGWALRIWAVAGFVLVGFGRYERRGEMEESWVREEKRGKSRALRTGWKERQEERGRGRVSESRVGVPESLVLFVVDNGCTERQRGRLGGLGLGVGFILEFWFQLEAISATINGEGMVVCSLWGCPARKGLLREVWKNLISLFLPLLEQFVPEWIAIVGSGYIGLEFSDIYTALGSEVTFIEALDQLMPGFDPEIGKLAQRVLINPQKIDYQTGVFASKSKEPKETLKVDVALIATGRTPFTQGLGLENHATEHIGEVFKRVKKIQLKRAYKIENWSKQSESF